MKLENRVQALEKLGFILKSVGNKQPWGGFDMGITEDEYIAFDELVNRVRIFNGWFTEKEVRKSLLAWGNLLESEKINLWLDKYDLSNVNEDKTIGVIMAGNIPLVGMHDFISTYLVGLKSKIKLSSDDDKLLPYIIEILSHFDTTLKERIELVQAQLKEVDGVIATGSNNTSRYFEQYFSKYPNIIRKSRTSVAVIEGDETEEELKGLAEDVFAYYGLGCRNVTKVFLPKGYDLNNLFKAFFDFQYVVDNNKYANNYDYHKAIFLMERYDLLENGFILLKEDKSLTSPIGTLYYEYYDNATDVEAYLNDSKEQIQCVVSKKNIPFGNAQSPQLWDYADNVDTIAFLLSID